MLTLSVALLIGLGNLYAQTAPAADSKTEKTEVKKKSPEMRKAIAVDQAKSKAAAGAKMKGTKPAKAKVKAHEAQIREHGATKEEVKAHAAEAHADHKEDAKKEKIAAHKDEIKLHADSKQEAKAKMKRKHDKHKGE